MATFYNEKEKVARDMIVNIGASVFKLEMHFIRILAQATREGCSISTFQIDEHYYAIHIHPITKEEYDNNNFRIGAARGMF